MKESEFNSKSNPWGDYEQFRVQFESWDDWLKKAITFDKIKEIALREGKEVEHKTYMSSDGWIIMDVKCH